MRCNYCGSERFIERDGEQTWICQTCHSHKRMRALKLFLDQMDLGPHTRVLHIAPERVVSDLVRASGCDYVAGDIEPANYAWLADIQRLDLCDLSVYGELGQFDLILHNHVLEHVPCNWTSVIVRLHRLLKPGGTHCFSFPIYGEAYEEDLRPLDESEAVRRFGQWDHVRRFAAADLPAMLGMIFDLKEGYDLRGEFSEDLLDGAGLPEQARSGFA